jgi:small subunit ribosomal protein S2
LINVALQQIHKCISSGGRILFVSTKKQASETVSELAKDTSQFYVNHRWLGGMLTNWNTISNSIKRYKKLSEKLKKENIGFTKKEILKMGTERDKLERSLGGIADMKKVPDMIFIIDINVEALAVREALKLNIPIVAVVDTNSDPTGITFPIPGNDDARRAINLYCDLAKQTILDAQKHIKKQDADEKESIKESEIHKPEEKKVSKKPKGKTEASTSKKKKATSIFSKIRKLAIKK